MVQGVMESIMYGFVAIDKVVVPFIEKTITGMLPGIEKYGDLNSLKEKCKKVKEVFKSEVEKCEEVKVEETDSEAEECEEVKAEETDSEVEKSEAMKCENENSESEKPVVEEGEAQKIEVAVD